MAKNNDAMNNGLAYISRRDMHPGKGSSLKKLIRGARIAAGLRPIRRPKRQFFPVDVTFKGGSFFIVERAAILHFTKGYRPDVGTPDRLTKLSDSQAAEFFGTAVDPRPAVLAA